MQWFLILLSCGALIGVDRWLKMLALGGVDRDFGFAQFVLFKNDTLVFSWPAPNAVAIWLMAAAMVVVLYIFKRQVQQANFIGVFGASLILSGAGSNLYDRIVHGFVIDWAYLGRWWPVFNLADVMIGVGLVMLIFLRPKIRSSEELTKLS